MEKVVGRPFKKGQGGRPPGRPNKVTAQLKDMILIALDRAGGADYLLAQAQENPPAFMTLVGKVLPMTLQGSDGEAPKIHVTVEYV